MSDFKEIQDKIDEERAKGAFIFMPSPILSMEDSFMKPSIETVFLRDDEIYEATSKFRIHYNGLLRLAAAAAFKWSAIDTCRTDARNDKMYISFRAVGGVTRADGTTPWHKAEKDIDFEIIEMELEDQYKNTWGKIGNNKKIEWKKNGHKTIETFVPAMVRRDLIQKRKNGLTNVESGAKARVIRFVLGLQSQYSSKEQLIGMPFLMVSYSPNINHPGVKQAITRQLPESMSMIYGGVKDTGQIAMNPSDEDIIEIPVSKSSHEPDQEPDPGQGQEPDKGRGYAGQKPEATSRKFQPEQAKENGSLIDFQNIPAEEQAKILKKMCSECNQDYDHYNKQAKGGIIKAEQKWRDDFFTFLKNEKENK